MTTDDPIRIDLSTDEALVLFEYLQRFRDGGESRIEDPSEARVLWNIACELEKILVEPFDTNYTALLARARVRLRDEI
jgi:hypothetical protein